MKILLAALFLCAQITNAQQLNVVPMPAEVQMKTGHLTIRQPIGIIYSTGIDHGDGVVNSFIELLRRKYGFTKFIEGDTHSYGLPTEIFLYFDEQFKNEDYKLEINGNKILISGDARGIFYAFPTLAQVWSPKEKRNWKDFERRLPALFKLYRSWKANYSNAYFDLQPSAFSLVDGVQNTKGMVKSVQFLGFLGTDMEVIIDLDSTQNISEIILHSFEQTGSWIYRPASVAFYASDDGKEFKLIQTLNEGTGSKNLLYKINTNRKARHLKIFAKNFGTIPQGMPGSGNKAWLFADEIEVK